MTPDADTNTTTITRKIVELENAKQSETVLRQGMARGAEIHQSSYGLDRYSWNQGYNAKYDFQFFENEEPALVARGGQPYVAESPWLLYQDKIGALCATDHKWVQQEQVVQNKLIPQKRQ